MGAATPAYITTREPVAPAPAPSAADPTGPNRRIRRRLPERFERWVRFAAAAAAHARIRNSDVGEVEVGAGTASALRRKPRTTPRRRLAVGARPVSEQKCGWPPSPGRSTPSSTRDRPTNASPCVGLRFAGSDYSRKPDSARHWQLERTVNLASCCCLTAALTKARRTADALGAAWDSDRT